VEGEGFDLPDLMLPWGQDAVIDAVASANPNSVVVLETGNPCSMPWRDKVKAIVQAWYPGQAGGQAIAEVLFGKVNPSGHLPITFPADLLQTPRPELPGLARRGRRRRSATTRARRSATAGSRKPVRGLYAFGHGLSYTTFSFSGLQVSGGDTARASFTVTNTGTCEGPTCPSFISPKWPVRRMRLLGFERCRIETRESRRTHDPRLRQRHDSTCQRSSGGLRRLYVVALSRAPMIRSKARIRLDGRCSGGDLGALIVMPVMFLPAVIWRLQLKQRGPLLTVSTNLRRPTASTPRIPAR
jgi:beta-glucosidase